MEIVFMVKNTNCYLKFNNWLKRRESTCCIENSPYANFCLYWPVSYPASLPDFNPFDCYPGDQLNQIVYAEDIPDEYMSHKPVTLGGLAD